MKKADRVHGVFQRIAGGYDRANDRISLGMQKRWKRMLTGRIIKGAPWEIRLLDVCCGTGDIALRIARKREDIQVTGVDFSSAMLRIARRKRDREGLSQAMFLEADAMSLPFPEDSFAAATISFGLRNTADYMQVLKEMVRVVRPGGCIYCLDSFVPEHGWVRPFYRLYFHKLMPLLGGGRKYLQDYRWLSESTEKFLQPTELMHLFRRAGLRRVRKKEKMFGACVLIWGQVE